MGFFFWYFEYFVYFGVIVLLCEFVEIEGLVVVFCYDVDYDFDLVFDMVF